MTLTQHRRPASTPKGRKKMSGQRVRAHAIALTTTTFLQRPLEFFAGEFVT